ncbi:PKD domain-containing protein [Chitinophaga arvensicola]|uniref:PKD/Chitinase domain-containing protein n=1 Tax=Chitinophaga arvensicola TaxID=29529 RepID=A0A1I0R9P2_9BACT|nr:hypothetical protein [Chitinophaga arvensicola]SEW37540.1 hypothetical protein SAMN04488122_2518 [Chitinophaga arvensicola]
MAQNTGFVRYGNLEEYIIGTGLPTGNIKRNKPLDPDYVAPAYDPVICPLTPSASNVKNEWIIRISNKGSQFLNFLSLEVAAWDKSSSIYKAKCLLLPGEVTDLVARPVQQITDWIDLNFISGNFSKKFSVNMDAYFTDATERKLVGNITLDNNTGKTLSRLHVGRTATGGVNLLELIVTDLPGSTVSNEPPVANAGADQEVLLTDDLKLLLNGSGTDSDGQVVNYHWDKIMGPLPYHLSDPNIAAPELSGLVKGIYKFQLTVTDNRGAIGQSEVTVTVNAVSEDTAGTLVALVESGLTNAAVTQIQLIASELQTDLLTTAVTAADGPVLKNPVMGKYKMYVTISGSPGAVKAEFDDTTVCQPFHGEGLYIFPEVTIGAGSKGLALSLVAAPCNTGADTSVFVRMTTTNTVTTEQALVPFGKKKVQKADIKASFYKDADGQEPVAASLLLNYRVETTNLKTGQVEVTDTYTTVENLDSVLIGGTLLQTVYDLTLPAGQQMVSDRSSVYTLLPGMGYRLI